MGNHKRQYDLIGEKNLGMCAKQKPWILCIGLKIMEYILLARFNDVYDSYARDNQAGFKKGRGCRDRVFALRQIIEQRTEYKRSLVMI